MYLSGINVNSDFKQSIIPSQNSKGKCKKRKKAEHISSTKGV